jgi:hypothetical protein
MWWARTTVNQTVLASASSGQVPGFAFKFVPDGVELSGLVVGPTIFFTTVEWEVQIRSDYFLDPPRMPATGTQFVTLPKMEFKGALGLAGGANQATAIGDAVCTVSFRQMLRFGDNDVASSNVDWMVGFIRGKNVILGKNNIIPQHRDFGALFFNLDRTRTVGVTLLTTLHFKATLGGVIGFAPLTVGAPQWKVFSLDS